jgi:hypothetical protein
MILWQFRNPLLPLNVGETGLCQEVNLPPLVRVKVGLFRRGIFHGIIAIKMSCVQWLMDANIDLNDPANAGLCELRALLSAEQGSKEAPGSAPVFHVSGQDDSHLRQPTYARRDRWRGARARWHAVAARAALGHRGAAKALWQLEGQAGAGTDDLTMAAGQQLSLASDIRHARLQDHISRVLAMQAKIARTCSGKCVVIFRVMLQHMLLGSIFDLISAGLPMPRCLLYFVSWLYLGGRHHHLLDHC